MELESRLASLDDTGLTLCDLDAYCSLSSIPPLLPPSTPLPSLEMSSSSVPRDLCTCWTSWDTLYPTRIPRHGRALAPGTQPGAQKVLGDCGQNHTPSGPLLQSPLACPLLGGGGGCDGSRLGRRGPDLAPPGDGWGASSPPYRLRGLRSSPDLMVTTCTLFSGPLWPRLLGYKADRWQERPWSIWLLNTTPPLCQQRSRQATPFQETAVLPGTPRGQGLGGCTLEASFRVWPRKSYAGRKKG